MFSWQIDNNIRLELLQSHHAQEIFALTDRNREYLRQWLPWVDAVKEPEDTANYVKNSQQSQIENGNFKAAIQVENNIAGIIGHHEIDWQNEKTSLGYWLGQSYEGQGIMTKCCGAVVQHAFDQLGLHRVEIHCAADNKKSRGVPERLGFAQEATQKEAIKINGQFKDRIIYCALAHEWNLPTTH